MEGLPSGFAKGSVVEVSLMPEHRLRRIDYYSQVSAVRGIVGDDVTCCFDLDSCEKEDFVSGIEHTMVTINRNLFTTSPHIDGSSNFLVGNSNVSTLIVADIEAAVSAALKLFDRSIATGNDPSMWAEAKDTLTELQENHSMRYAFQCAMDIVGYRDVNVLRRLQISIPFYKRFEIDHRKYGASSVGGNVLHARSLINKPNVRPFGDEIFVTGL